MLYTTYNRDYTYYKLKKAKIEKNQTSGYFRAGRGTKTPKTTQQALPNRAKKQNYNVTYASLRTQAFRNLQPPARKYQPHQRQAKSNKWKRKQG